MTRAEYYLYSFGILLLVLFTSTTLWASSSENKLIKVVKTEENIKTKGVEYSNKFVGLRYSVPDGWYIVADNETKNLMSDAGRVMDFDTPVAKSVLDQMPGKVLLMVSEHPINSDSQSANQNVIFVAINAREMKSEISSGSDYLSYVARGMRESQSNSTISDIVIQPLGGEEFHRINIKTPMQGITGYMSQMARFHNDYILILNLSAGSYIGLTELVKMVDHNIHLSDVSEEVDKSPEGTSFRKQSSLNLSKESNTSSQGRGIIKYLGILLIIFGIFSMFRNFFGQKQ